jgi:hypothetical protein
MHRDINVDDDDAIALPLPVSAIGRIAGRSDILSMRGVLGQLTALIWAPALILANFNLITYRQAADIMGISTAILLAIDLLFLFLRARRRRKRDGA